MGSRFSFMCGESNRVDHLAKFKVTQVDYDGSELGSGILELTQTELILHRQKRNSIHWPYLCLRRYGFTSNFFTFESGNHCKTGRAIFAFKISKAEKFFGILQERMVGKLVKKPNVMTCRAQKPLMDMSLTLLRHNASTFRGLAVPNGFQDFSIRGVSSPSSYNMQNLNSPKYQTPTYANTSLMDNVTTIHSLAGTSEGNTRQSRSWVRDTEHCHMAPSQQLNYIQVDVEEGPSGQAFSSGGAQSQPLYQHLQPIIHGQQAPRRSECYAVIDRKRTIALSYLKKARPRDDGCRKTRHNSTVEPF